MQAGKLNEKIVAETGLRRSHADTSAPEGIFAVPQDLLKDSLGTRSKRFYERLWTDG
jgi:hypothetical protein